MNDEESNGFNIGQLLRDDDEQPSFFGSVRTAIRAGSRVRVERAKQARIEAKADTAIVTIDAHRRITESAAMAQEATEDAKFRSFLAQLPSDMRQKVLAAEIATEEGLTIRQRLRSTRAGYTHREREASAAITGTLRQDYLLEGSSGSGYEPEASPSVHTAFSEEELDATALKAAASVAQLPYAQAEKELGKWRAQIRTAVPSNIMTDLENRVQSYRAKMA